jgi:PAS domain S-box-containing protein
MKATRPHALIAGFLAALVLLGGVEWLSFHHTTRAVAIAGMLGNSHRIRDDVDRLLALVLEIDAQHRSILLSDEVSSARALEDGLKLVAAQQLALEETILHPGQKANAAALRPTLAEWSDLMRSDLQERRNSGVGAARSTTPSDRAFAKLEQIRQHFDRMYAGGRAFVDERSAAGREEARNARLLMAGGIGLSFALLIAVFGLLLHENRLRRRTQEALQEAYVRLDQRVQERTAELARAVESLKSSERRFRALIEHGADTITLVDADDKILYLSPAIASVEGYAPEELLGRSSAENTHPDDLAMVREVTSELMASPGKAIPILWRRRHKDGRWVWLEGMATNLLHDGAIGAIVTNRRDVTDRRAAEAALRGEQALLNSLIDTIPDRIYFKDRASRFVRINDSLTKWFDLRSASDAVGKTDFDYFTDEHARQAFDGEQRVMETGEPIIDLEEKETWPDGRITWMSSTKVPLRDVTGRITGLVGISRETTERHRAERTLQKSEEHFRFLNNLAEATRALVDPAQIMVVMTRMLGEQLRVSRCAYADVEKDGEWFVILHDHTDGCSSSTGRYLLSLFGVRTAATLRLGQTLVVRSVDAEVPPDNGAAMFNAIGVQATVVSPLFKGGYLRALMGVQHTTPRDWTPEEIALVEEVAERCWATIERGGAEKALRESLAEKVALLKEVHHRVKNNLQVISSLLRLETSRSKQPETQVVLRDMQGRIQAMALLHESLYRSSTFASVDLGAYLRQLAAQSLRALTARPGSIQLDLNLTSVQAGMDQAIPCGLLLNELISNSLKHGFPGGLAGKIRIELQAVNGGTDLRLCVTDTGVGVPEDFEARRGQSLGLQLVAELARQMQASVEKSLDATFTMTFPNQHFIDTERLAALMPAAVDPGARPHQSEAGLEAGG